MVRFLYLLKDGVWRPMNIVDRILNLFQSELVVQDLAVYEFFMFFALGLWALLAELLIWASDAADRLLYCWIYKELLPILHWLKLLVHFLIIFCRKIWLLYFGPVTCSWGCQNFSLNHFALQVIIRTKFSYLNVYFGFITKCATCLRGLNVLFCLLVPLRSVLCRFPLCFVLKRLSCERVRQRKYKSTFVFFRWFFLEVSVQILLLGRYFVRSMLRHDRGAIWKKSDSLLQVSCKLVRTTLEANFSRVDTQLLYQIPRHRLEILKFPTCPWF